MRAQSLDWHQCSQARISSGAAIPATVVAYFRLQSNRLIYLSQNKRRAWTKDFQGKWC